MNHRSMHLLVVDDNPGDVELLRFAFESARLPVNLRVAQDGDAALEELARNAEAGDLPELMLLDLNMPRRDGFGVLSELRDRKLYPALPVAVWTSSTAPRDRERALGAGAVAVLPKPSGIEEYESMISTLQELLRSRCAPGGPASASSPPAASGQAERQQE